MKKVIKNKKVVKYPSLTSEEVEAFISYEKEFIDKEGIWGIKFNWAVASCLGGLAVNKMLGIKGYKKNLQEAKEHFLKADLFWSDRKYSLEDSRKELGLPPPLTKPENYKGLGSIWEGAKKMHKIVKDGNRIVETSKS